MDAVDDKGRKSRDLGTGLRKEDPQKAHNVVKNIVREIFVLDRAVIDRAIGI